MQSLKRDGVSLCFAHATGGAPPVVLLHGWCCDHSYCAPQYQHFAGRGHALLAPDLRGHGASDKPRGGYTMASFADDVVWLCRELQVAKPVIVGHSMGGIIAFDIAARYPDFAAGFAMLDSAVFMPAAARAGIPAFLDKLRGPDYRTALRDLARQVLFLPTDDAARMARILDGMTATPHDVMVSAYEGLRDYDATIARGRTLAPGLYIAADEPSPRSDLAALRALAPGLMEGRVVGSGHFCQLEVPDQVNAMLDRFIAVAVKPAV